MDKTYISNNLFFLGGKDLIASRLINIQFFFFIFIVLLFFVPVAFCQTSKMWDYTYGGDSSEEAFSVVETADGGYVVAGFTRSFGAGEADVWLFKIDSSGNMIWNQTYGGPANDRSWDMVQTSDGGFAIGGYVFSLETGADALLIKTDSSGNIQWNRTFGGGGVDYCFSLIQTSDGGYALAGETTSWGAGDDFWLVKTNNLGNIEWNKTYGEGGIDRAWSVIQTADGGYALAGQKRWSDVGDFYVVKTDSAGNMIWDQTYGGALNEIAYSIVEASDGGFVIAGETSSYAALPRSNYLDCYLVKTDADGNMQWNKTCGAEYHGRAYSLIKTNDGGYAMAGDWASPVDGNMDYWLIKTDQNGDVEWEQKYGREHPEWAYSVTQASDGGYVLAGIGHPRGGNPSNDVWVIKTDQYGVIPEFPSLTLVLLLVVAVMLVAVIYRKRLVKLDYKLCA